MVLTSTTSEIALMIVAVTYHATFIHVVSQTP